jgi:hypothetical protein
MGIAVENQVDARRGKGVGHSRSLASKTQEKSI